MNTLIASCFFLVPPVEQPPERLLHILRQLRPVVAVEDLWEEALGKARDSLAVVEPVEHGGDEDDGEKHFGRPDLAPLARAQLCPPLQLPPYHFYGEQGQRGHDHKWQSNVGLVK